jgi:DNA-directed RNA polymerase subunit RPC12/RpoP
MSATRVELVSAETGLDCMDCGRPTQHVVLVNEHGLVLLRGRACTDCGGRHRIEDLVPAPRKSA